MSGAPGDTNTHHRVHLVVPGDVSVEGSQHDHGHHPRQEQHDHQRVHDADGKRRERKRLDSIFSCDFRAQSAHLTSGEVRGFTSVPWQKPVKYLTNAPPSSSSSNLKPTPSPTPYQQRPLPMCLPSPPLSKLSPISQANLSNILASMNSPIPSSLVKQSLPTLRHCPFISQTGCHYTHPQETWTQP